MRSRQFASLDIRPIDRWTVDLSTMVRSSRVKSGGYLTDMTRESAVHVVANQRLLELEAEIERLKAGFDQTRQKAKEETAEETKRQVEEAQKNGYAQGKTDGLMEGQSSVRAEVDEAKEVLRKLVEDIKAGLDTVWEECRKCSLELTLLIAEKVTGNIAGEYKELAKDLTVRGMAMVRDQSRVQILVNPENADYLRRQTVDLMSLTEGVKEIEIIEHSSVTPGGVIIETDAGQIDGRIEEQLGAVIAALKPGWSKPELERNNDRSERKSDK